MSNNSFTPNEGVTPSEKYLQLICRKTFLSLWSYPGLFKGAGEELCDLLIVFDSHIIIFSDKYIKFPNSGNLQKDWEKWYKKAIYNSAKQAWGAERWIKKFPEKIFTNSKATNKFPFVLPDISKAKFHLIAVAHNGSQKCAEIHGGSGSFILNIGSNAPDINKPFYIGDIDKSRTFVHVLDDTTLDILLSKLDTITDFVAYLEKKEKLFRTSSIIIYAPGEEELLAHYLKNMNKQGEHDFNFSKDYNMIMLGEGDWLDFINNPQTLRQREADSISYSWDDLIEKFNYHALTGTQYKTSDSPLLSSENVMRIMASESRTKRRMLSKIIHDLISKTPIDKQAIRYISPPDPNSNETTYVFLLYPKKPDLGHDEYRRQRSVVLETSCMIAKVRFPHAKKIVGIATETGLDDMRSEDAIYIDDLFWTPELQKEAELIFNEMGFKKNLKNHHYHETEYPDKVDFNPNNLTVDLPKNPRNKLCPCGSGKKYKRCHGK
ncbi:MAG: SEC-C domain-containing protein [Ignavibacteria bacterium]|nr:SEC-C domain-containing protein [Ignavibacteria bacterium]